MSDEKVQDKIRAIVDKKAICEMKPDEYLKLLKELKTALKQN